MCLFLFIVYDFVTHFFYISTGEERRETRKRRRNVWKMEWKKREARQGNIINDVTWKWGSLFVCLKFLSLGITL